MNIRHDLSEANGPFRLKTQNFRVVLARVRYVDYSLRITSVRILSSSSRTVLKHNNIITIYCFVKRADLISSCTN